ncbi:hypothetical protein HPB48_003854 [Haemaphysalis longicornis]|uniref:Uncharacterized protein n=1 Tax=Haemaphysalis longicornis TaxID=44386 RepID=A0A9J6FJJ4_HAELO|nr:hypothetical protein HPB48_003854 [Haemaphysalis longicornis]
MITMVEGETISAQEYEDDNGWLPSHRRKFGRALAQLKQDAKRLADVSVQEPGSSSHQSRERMRKQPPQHRPKYPRLPKDDIKSPFVLERA